MLKCSNYWRNTVAPPPSLSIIDTAGACRMGLCSSAKRTSTATVDPSDKYHAKSPEKPDKLLDKAAKRLSVHVKASSSMMAADKDLASLLARVSESDQNRALTLVNRATAFSIAEMPSENLIYISPTFEKTFGYSCDEVRGTNCRFLQGKDTNQVARKLMRKAINAKKGVIVMLRNYHRDGTLINNLVSLKPMFDENGVNFAYLGCQEDVTKHIPEVSDALQEKIAGLDEGGLSSSVLKAEFGKQSKFFGEDLDEIYGAVKRGGNVKKGSRWGRRR